MANDAQIIGETELKFSLDGRVADQVPRHRLLAELRGQARPQCSVYFDTPEATLRRKGYSLRVRQVGDHFTQTLKTRASQAGLFDRGEWEMPVAGKEPDLAALAKTPLKGLKALGGSLKPVVCSDVERTTWLVDHLDSAIEVVLDSGAVTAAGKKLAFHELELELKHGEPAAMFSLARMLLESFPLRLGVLSKEERGEMLAHGLGSPQKASPLTFDDSMTVEQVFGQILTSTVRQFRLNEYSILAHRDHEGLHQARIAMRRLRGALTLFRPAVGQAGLQRLRGELRWFTSSLAEARDLDVFLADHDDLVRADRKTLQSARRAAYDEVTAAIDSQRLRNLLLDLVEWLTIGDWQKADASAPIARFASKRLDVLWKKVRQNSSDLAGLNDERLHQLRIHCKKLRYAVEFLASLYGKDTRKFTSKLEQIQDGLGRLNDETIGRILIARLELRADAEVVFAGSRFEQVRDLQKHFKSLRKVGRFWA